MARVPAFQAGYAGSIPVTRSIRLFPSRLPEGLRFPCLVAGVALVDANRIWFIGDSCTIAL